MYKDVSIFVFILTVLFGTSVFINYDATWAESPILVQKLPEYWNLPSYLVIAVQCFGQLGAWIYFIAHRIKPNIGAGEEGGIVGIIVLYILCILSTIFTIIFWDETTVIFGELHSTAFLILVAVSGLTNFCSSLVFLSYMVRLPTAYIAAYHTGEGLSGLIPSIAVIIQGPGRYTCVNTTTDVISENVTLTFDKTGYNDTNMDAIYEEPLYSVEAYFSFVLALIVLCVTAFLLLHFLPYCKEKHVKVSEPKRNEHKFQNSKNHALPTNNEILVTAVSFKKAVQTNNDGEIEMFDDINSNKWNSIKNSKEASTSESSGNLIEIEDIHAVETVSTGSFIWLLFLQAWMIGLKYGVCDAIQAYTGQPYGTTVYNLVTQLTLVALPVGSFITTFFSTRSVSVISVLGFVNLLAATYIVVLAVMSPFPPLVTSMPELGGALSIMAWVILALTLGYGRTLISSIAKDRGERALMLFAITTLAGPLVFSIPMFVFVNVLNFFKDSPPCGATYI